MPPSPPQTRQSASSWSWPALAGAFAGTAVGVYGFSSLMDARASRIRRARTASGLSDLAGRGRRRGSSIGAGGAASLLSDVREVFEDVDADASGVINLDELQRYVRKWLAARLVDPMAAERLEALGVDASLHAGDAEAEVVRVFRAIDVDGSGSLTLPEFQLAFILNLQARVRRRGIGRVFDDVAQRATSGGESVPIGALIAALVGPSDVEDRDGTAGTPAERSLWEVRAAPRLRQLGVDLPSPLTAARAARALGALVPPDAAAPLSDRWGRSRVGRQAFERICLGMLAREPRTMAVQALFMALDADGNGRISLGALRTALVDQAARGGVDWTALGLSDDPLLLAHAVAEQVGAGPVLDAGRGGADDVPIDFDDFLAALGADFDRNRRREGLEAVFRALDEAGDGELTPAELGADRPEHAVCLVRLKELGYDLQSAVAADSETGQPARSALQTLFADHDGVGWEDFHAKLEGLRARDDPLPRPPTARGKGPGPAPGASPTFLRETTIEAADRITSTSTFESDELDPSTLLMVGAAGAMVAAAAGIVVVKFLRRRMQ
jgi:Ca2+-binding EF-hand superfamily protein